MQCCQLDLHILHQCGCALAIVDHAVLFIMFLLRVKVGVSYRGLSNVRYGDAMALFFLIIDKNLKSDWPLFF